MLLENTRMREMMLKARMTFSPMNTSKARRVGIGIPPNGGSSQDSQARGGSIVVGGGEGGGWGKRTTKGC